MYLIPAIWAAHVQPDLVGPFTDTLLKVFGH
jgi:hypothetical protein